LSTCLAYSFVYFFGMDRQVSESGKWVQAMKPGTFKDFSGVERTFTPDDIANIAKGVQAQVGNSYMPPMVKGHPTTDSPRVASIVDAKVGDKNILMLKVDKAEPKFAEEVKNGEYPYVSVALYKDYSKGIKHLGALGAAAPAIKGLEPVQLAEGSDDVICFASGFGYSLGYAMNTIGKLFRRLREKLIEDSGIEAADDIYSDWDIRVLEDFKPPEESLGSSQEFAEANGEKKTESDEFEKENKALKEEVEALKAEKAKAEAEAKKNAFAEKLENLQKAGRLGAGQRQHLEKIFELAGCGSLSFAEGEQHEDIEKTLLDFADSLPSVVKPGEFQFAENNRGSAEVSVKIQELVNSTGCTYAEAAKELAKGRQQ